MKNKAQASLYVAITIVVIAVILVLALLFAVLFFNYSINSKIISNPERNEIQKSTCRTITIPYEVKKELKYDSFAWLSYDCDDDHYYRYRYYDEDDDRYYYKYYKDQDQRCYNIEVYNQDDVGGIFEVECNNYNSRRYYQDSVSEYIPAGESVTFSCRLDDNRRYRYNDLSYDVNAPTKTEIKYNTQVVC